MRTKSNPKPTTATAEPAKSAKPINSQFVHTERSYLTPEQVRAWQENRRASREIEYQWAKITGIRLPE